MREGRQLIPQSILWDRFLFTGVVSNCQESPHCSVTFGWVVLLLVSSYLLCYNSACPVFTQFFSILHFLCPRDTNIISPFIPPPLLQFRVERSLPEDSFPHPIEVFFSLPHINKTIGEPIKQKLIYICTHPPPTYVYVVSRGSLKMSFRSRNIRLTHPPSKHKPADVVLICFQSIL